jgi:RNA polymerase sigma-70 factor, ECF subfamily
MSLRRPPMLRPCCRFIAFTIRTEGEVMIGRNLQIQCDSMLPTDGALVSQALAGRQSAFSELFTRYQTRAVAVSYRLLKNVHDAFEISQEAFLKAFTNLARLRNINAFGAWLLRIVSNLSLNLRRSRKPENSLPPQNSICATATGKDPFVQLQNKEITAQLLQALGRLPYRQQTALILFAFEGMPQKEIAKTLNCSVEAVKWHVFQGRKKLLEVLDHAR